MDQSFRLALRNEEFIFDYRRAVFWPGKKILLATDLHWGKTSFFQRHGIAISDQVLDEDLLRLGQLIQDYKVETLIVLGDLIHHEKSINPWLTQKVLDFRHSHPCELILIKGNHDRYTEFPEAWGIVEENELRIGTFLMTHESQRRERSFQFSGHVHPTLKLRTSHDVLRLPAFIIKENACLLPAFSLLTSGQDVRLLKGEMGIGITENSLEVFRRS